MSVDGGASIQRAGFARGDRWTLILKEDEPGVMYIARLKEDAERRKGERKVSGKGDKPIIDISGATVPDCASVTLEIMTEGLIKVSVAS